MDEVEEVEEERGGVEEMGEKEEEVHPSAPETLALVVPPSGTGCALSLTWVIKFPGEGSYYL